MKNLDLISKRIAVIGIAICGVLLSASMLVFSIRSIGNASATPTPEVKALQADAELIPLGISNGSAYYIFRGDKWEFNKIDITKAAPAPWVK